MPARRYPIRAVARLTGLSLDTLRAWERRYEAVVPERGPRGRLYTEAHVERLRLLREAVEQGHAIGLAARHDTPTLRALVAQGRAAGPAAGAAPADTDRLAPVVVAIEALDAAAADQHLGRLALLLPPRAFVLDVALPLMRETGERWHRGEYTVAQEHLVSALLRHLLGTLIRLHTPPGARPALLFATPEGELHEFGILAGAMLATAAGHGVLYLGPSLPAADIAAAAARVLPRAVVLGLTAAGDRPAVLDEVRALARALPATVELWVGGVEVSRRGARRGGAPAVMLADFDAFERHLGRLGEAA
jgi:methanogenic corrinoid protein MtbC1